MALRNCRLTAGYLKCNLWKISRSKLPFNRTWLSDKRGDPRREGQQPTALFELKKNGFSLEHFPGMITLSRRNFPSRAISRGPISIQLYR